MTSAILAAIKELESSLSPTSNEEILHFAAIILLECLMVFGSLFALEEDLAYPIDPNALMPPSRGKIVYDSWEPAGTQLRAIGSKLSFTFTMDLNRFVIFSMTSIFLTGVSHFFSRLALHTSP